MKKRGNFYLLFAFVAAFCLLLTSSGSAQVSIEGAVLSQVSDEQGLQLESLSVVNMQEVSLPLTGVTFTEAKVIDQNTGMIYGASVDANGVKVDSGAARQAEKAAYRARYGRLEPALYDLLQFKADTDLIQVGIWLKTPQLSTASRPDLQLEQPAVQDGNATLPASGVDRAAVESAHEKTDEEIAAGQVEQAEAVALQTKEELAAQAAQDEAYQQEISVLSQQVALIEQPLVTKLRSQGYEPIYISTYAPVIFVELPKDAILSLNQREDVDTIYGPSEYHDMLDSARPTQKGTFVNLWGFMGTGVKVAILEDNRIEFTNPYIPDGITRDMGGTTDQHSAATAGIVASTHSTYQGIASGVSLYSANAPGYIEANITAAMDWAVSQGVDVINNSWGGNAGNTNLNIFDRHLDYIVRNYWQTVTVAAGNEADGCGTGTGQVTSPARGFNVISVGNYADMNTLTWADDAMDSCSSYVNPSTGIEKPELAAVGSDINSTTNTSPWYANVGSGTSYSSPMVAGEAALMMQWDTAMKRWPEPVKAMLMATALHNVEGASRLSDKDGAGGVDMRAAFHTSNIYARSGGSVSSSNFPLHNYFYAYAGETVRAVIAWDSNPAGDYSTDPLQADLDLCVYDPSAAQVGCSTSYYNSYEIVEFTAPSNGTYEMRTTAYRFDGTSEWVGMAWWTGHRVLTTYSPQTWGTPPASYDYYRIAPNNNYWNVTGIRSPSGNDYDLYLYANSAFGNPSVHTGLSASINISPVDFVLIDNNHAALGYYYPEVTKFSGSGGNYPIEWAGYSSIYDGTFGPYTMAPSNVVRVWDNWSTNGLRKRFAIRPTAGDADLGMALYASDSANSTTWYQQSNQYVAMADANTAGGSETMNYLPSATDWMGLVVWNNGSTTNTSFYLYADTTSPDGTISINGGAAYANSTNVTLNLSGVDAETGVYQMHFSNDLLNWTDWEAYATSKAWTLTSGDGTKTVYVQYKNNAEMSSGSILDTIVLDTVKPTGTIVINSGATYTNSTSVVLTLSATDDRSGIMDMRLGNLGHPWGSWEPYTTSKVWTLDAGDGDKSVWVEYRDNAGNVSDQYGDHIILDTIAPTNPTSITGSHTPGVWSADNTVDVDWSGASDGAGSGVYGFSFVWTESSGTLPDYILDTTGHTITSPALSTGSSWYIHVRTLDVAGNWNAGAAHFGPYYIDTSVPVNPTSANPNCTATNNTWQNTCSDPNFTWSGATDTGSGVAGYFYYFGTDPSGTSSNYTTTAGFDPPAVGNPSINYLRVQTKDNVGLLAASWATLFTFRYDGQAPSNPNSFASSSHTLGVWSGDNTIDVQWSGATDGAGSGLGGYSIEWTSNASTLPDTTMDTNGNTNTSPALSTGSTWYFHIRTTDLVGNWSLTAVHYGPFFIDVTPPTGSVIINGGATYANTTSVSLGLSATDAGSGVSQMRFSNDNATWSSWEAYATSKSWSLTSGDGTKTVYVQYRDAINNASGNFTDTIILDTTPPSGSVSINAGATYATSTSVNLTLAATDAGSGVSQMQFSNNGSSWSDWEAYATSKAWTLTSGDGTKTVYVQYKDNQGNTSTSFTDTIILDTNPPSGSISINAGAAATNSTSVSLTLSATDAGSGVSQMQFSNDGSSWSGWEAYATSKAWSLTSGDGTKTVYVQYKDNLGNTSTSFNDTITLDTAPPSGSIVINAGAVYANSTSVNLTLAATDAGSGVSQMQFSNAGSIWSGWEAYAASKAWTLSGGDGTKTVYVQYRDGAGNVSSNFTDTILLDTTAPSGSIVINGGAVYATSTSASLSLSATDAGSGVFQMRFSNDNATWSGWEAYAISKAWTLASGDGVKTVYIQYSDNAGNVSTSFTDTIILDMNPPSGSVSINAGAAYTNSASVSLTLAATDAGSGVSQMQFSNDGSSWSGWEAYATSKSWTLISGDATKTVYVQYKDNLDNTSTSFTDTIILDTNPPSSMVSSPANSMNLSFTVSWTGSDAYSGVVAYDVQYRVGTGGTWTDWLNHTTATSSIFGPTNPLVVARGETYYFQVRAYDGAGNMEIYPGGDGDTSTYIESIAQIYLPFVIR